MLNRLFLGCLGFCVSVAVCAQVPGFVSGVLEVEWEKPSQGASPSQRVPDPGSQMAHIFEKYQVRTFTSLCPRIPSLSHFYELHFDDVAHTEELMNELRKVQGIRGVEMVPIATLEATIPGDMDPQILWYMERIKMKESWELEFNKDHPIKIAVVDNAIRITHEDIRDNLWVNEREVAKNGIDDDGNGYIDDVNGFDVSDNDANPSPPSNADPSKFLHGTQVAGLTSASTNNGKGIVSVGYNTVIIAVKCVRDDAKNDMLFNDGWKGVQYAIAAGADIINLSWAQNNLTEFQRSLLDLAMSRGIIIVASAGNAGQNNVLFPAAYEGVIAVGATNADDVVAYNYGAKIDVMAPGVGIYTTFGNADNAYGFVSGTSFSTPIVSGFIGLLLSQNIDPNEVLELIKKGCDNIDIENEHKIGLMGAGRINVDRTIEIWKNGGVGFEPVAVNDGAMLYPNPSNGMLQLSTGAVIQEVTVFDLSGREVATIKGTDTFADLRAFQLKGLYVVRVRTEEGISNARIYFQ